jgi:hypothetical protein
VCTRLCVCRPCGEGLHALRLVRCLPSDRGGRLPLLFPLWPAWLPSRRCRTWRLRRR